MRLVGRLTDAGVPGATQACAEDELARLETAIQQLERAELYVVAALEVGLEDPFQRRLLEDLRGQVAAARRSLARPRVIDQAFSR